GGPVGDFELLLCHGTVCVVGKIRDLILQLSKSSIYSTKPFAGKKVVKVATETAVKSPNKLIEKLSELVNS
ncbi:PTS fructose IIA subunit, partial [Klebsiella pneumoniae]